MKKMIFLLLSSAFVLLSSAQQSLRVCSYVDKDGKTYSAKSIFSIKDGEELLMLVTADNELATTRLDYKIYRVENGNATFDVTITQDIQTSWVWSYKGVLFHSPGYYLIKVYKADGTYVCENMVYIDWHS
jgi:hypothetical protein